MKTTAKKIQAWACGRCGAPYSHKGVAETCCKCTECGGRTAYSGHHRLCRRCGLKQTIEKNKQFQREIAATLKQQETELSLLPP